LIFFFFTRSEQHLNTFFFYVEKLLDPTIAGNDILKLLNLLGFDTSTIDKHEEELGISEKN
jgi:hypothetical protein